MDILNKIRNFFLWPKDQEFNLSTLGDYLKASWLKLILFSIALFVIIWLIRKISQLIKDLFN